MAIYVCKVKNTNEIVWKLQATCIENAKIRFAQIKHLDINEYNRLFETEEMHE